MMRTEKSCLRRIVVAHLEDGQKIATIYPKTDIVNISAVAGAFFSGHM